MPVIEIIPVSEFRRVQGALIDRNARLAVLADMCRFNTLNTVKRAGSGHLGSSFSSLDIVVYLYYEELNTADVGFQDANRDIYFSSKGHDVPGLYSVLYALGVLPEQKFINLRRLGGTFGHPDIRVPGIEANTGSLGMGISKAKGMALAKRMRGLGGRVVVMTGDGELQEGQIYEAMLATANQRISNLIVIVDHNKLQSDKRVDDISPVGDIAAKGRAFGWHVERCDGHDFGALAGAFTRCRSVTDRPQMIIADTIKGKGISFMEHPYALEAGKGCYRWHAGAPDDESFKRASAELVDRVRERVRALDLDEPVVRDLPPEETRPSSATSEYISKAYGQALIDLAPKHPELVVLDGDLAVDCHVRAFELAYPERFIENGIAEQDMVSTAGGLARAGFVPVVNTFASFLTARANEQIYNNNCERTRIIYAAHYAGLIPAGPGATHQSVRDISLVAALPGVVIVQPANAEETRMAVEYVLAEASETCVLRMNIGPSPRQIALPPGYRLTRGRGAVLAGPHRPRRLLVSYGPVMLHEALIAHELLAAEDIDLTVVNLPWLNQADDSWLTELVSTANEIYVLEDHSPIGGLGDFLLRRLTALGLIEGKNFSTFGVEGDCACGTPEQALRYHALDGSSVASRIRECSTRPVLPGRVGRLE